MATRFEAGACDGESFLRSRGSPRHSSGRYDNNNGSGSASGNSGGGGFPSLGALLAANDISPKVQAHLLRVYLTLLMAVACAAAGATLDLFARVGGALTTVAALGVMLLLAATPATAATLTRRTRLLAVFSALQGASLGPLISLAALVDPSLIAVAFVGAALVFACFSCAAALTRRRSMLALGGVLSAAVTSFLWLHAAALLLPRSAFMLRALSLELYLGVFLFSGFILFDTQAIVEKASAGGDDHVAHALDLFVDAAGLFARLLAVLVRHAARREAAGGGGRGEEGRRDRRRRGGGAGAARSGRRV